MGKDQELLEAARTGSVAVVEKILSPKLRPRVLNQAIALASSFRRGGGPNCQDASGYTPLHHASLNGHVAVVITLLRYEAMPNIGDNKGSTPLHLASWNGHLEIVRLLISKGNKATVNIQNHDHDTSLHFAAQYGHTDVVALLLENNADPVITNKRAETPIHLAAQYGRLEAVQQLLRCQSLLERIPPTHSLLHLAARNGHHQIVKLLLDEGCNINHTLSSGTPLHEAAVFGKADVVRVLLEYDGKLDANIQDASGETALEKIEEHPSKKSVIISALIKAYIRKEPLPASEPDRPPSVNLENADLPSDGIRSRHSSGSPGANTAYSTYQNVCFLHPSPSSPPASCSPPSVTVSPEQSEPSQEDPKISEDTVPDFIPLKPTSNPLKPLRHHGSEPDLYENVALLRKKLPPKKPVRSSFGIFPSEDNQGKSVIRTVGQVDQSLLRSIYAKIENSEKQKVLSDTSESPQSVVPDCTHCDLEDSGDYAQLRTDAKIPTNSDTIERTQCKNDTHVQQQSHQQQINNQPFSNQQTNLTGKNYQCAEQEHIDNRITQGQQIDQSPQHQRILNDEEYQQNNHYQNKHHHHQQEKQHQHHQSKEKGNVPEKQREQCKKPQRQKTADAKIPVAAPRGSIRKPERKADEIDDDSTNSKTSHSTDFEPLTQPSDEVLYESLSQALSHPSNDQVQAEQTADFQQTTHLPGHRSRLSTASCSSTSSVSEYELLCEASTGSTFRPTSEQIETEVTGFEKLCLRRQETYESSGVGSLCTNSDSLYMTMKPVTWEEGMDDDGRAPSPTTPDIPPPSPNTAAQGIHSKLLPRSSCDCEGVCINARQVYRAREQTFDSAVSLLTTESEASFDRRTSYDESYSTDSSDPDILKPDEQDPFAGLIYGSLRGSRTFSVAASDRFSIASLERSLGSDSGQHRSVLSMEEIYNSMASQGNSDEENNEDWAKIQEIFESLRFPLARESAYFKDYQTDFQQMLQGQTPAMSISGWLETLTLQQYENIMVANGFDNLDFMGGDIIEDQDLIDIGILDDQHRNIILSATKNLPSIKPMGNGEDDSPIPDTLEEWLRSLLLTDYLENFLDCQILTMDRARQLWEFELANDLKINMVGHRKRILASLGNSRQYNCQNPVNSNEIQTNKNMDTESHLDIPRDLNIGMHLQDDGNQMNVHQSPCLDIDLFKDYSKVTSLKRNSAQSVPEVPSNPSCNTNRPSSQEISQVQNTNMEVAEITDNVQNVSATNGRSSLEQLREENIYQEVLPVIREVNDNIHPQKNGRVHHSAMHDRRLPTLPSEQKAKQHSNNIPDWKHKPEVLIKGCCNYTAYYLGSTLIKEVKGTESTRDACVKLRKSAKSLQKVPTITLSINYLGVKFIDAKSKMVITEHEIRNISCAAQDAIDLKTFAYITKDSQSDRHYCHVFNVKNVDVATEIILTLGQAFEIAYQMLLQARPLSIEQRL
ncbi:ankyrin repeat and sterile alpha motif domain-containing protein 1B-like isoform X2 [Anneissia japonica]|uniref:ankyrin repeat and sterile alpha motif domain-containing protein 1B-like isoform X2 n=1 Tax=Anneissia japonica TaxID=1529436 RepID=UPI001425AD40|nr:ankyrin repeat and sterile alpha motif domain-containing protein 1B-like isoform X2 [Anneissia japonica]